MRRLSAAAGLALLSTLAFAGPQPIGQRELSGRDNRFIELAGQGTAAGFRAVSPGRTIAFDASGIRMRLAGPALEKRAGGEAQLRYSFEGGAAVAPQGVNPSPTVYHWLVGERSQWMTDLKSYGALAYRGVWPGVDAVFAGDAGGFKYQFELAAGVAPEAVSLLVEGADSVRVTEAGALAWTIGGETVVDDAPLAFQPAGAGHATIAAAYRVQALGEGRWRIGFEVAGHDKGKALIIDPAWTGYSGLVGGNSGDQVYGVARDASGNTFACGVTRSSNLPFTVGTGAKGDDDAFVVKFSAAGVAQFVSYVGGSGFDTCNGIALDASGRVLLAGGTGSTNFPAVGSDGTSRFRRTKSGDRDAFVMRLTATGATVEYSGFIGGSEDDQANAIAVDSLGRAYVTGFSTCTAIPGSGCTNATVAFPAFTGPRTTHGGDALGTGGMDAFVARVDAGGTTLDYAGFIGGNGGAEMGNGIAVGADFAAFVAGATDSSAGLASPGGFRTTSNARGMDASDGFAAKVAAGGASLTWFTLLTGTEPLPGAESGADRALAIALDTDGTVVVAGETDSLNFPAAAGGARTGTGPQTSNGGGMDGFVLRLNATGMGIDSATYLGGPGHDSAEGVALDATALYVTGTTTNATGFPTVLQNGLAITPRGGQDGFLAKIVQGSPGTFAYSGFLGTTASETLRAIAASASGSHTILSAGGATSTSGTAGLVNPSTGALGSSSLANGLVLRIDPFGAPQNLVVQTGAGQSAKILQAFPVALTVLVRDVDNQELANVPVSFATPGTGASAVLSATSTTTNASGIASVTATANGLAGSYNVTVTATMPTGSAATTIALTNLKGDQSITFGTLADRTMLQTPFTVSAAASSTLAVAFSTTTTTACTVSGGNVTLVGAGTCTIDADQAGDANYNPAPRVSRAFTVSRVAQSITFDPLADRTMLETPFTVSATAGSTLPVTFSSTTTPVCTVSGTQVTLVAEGTCTIAADQGGNAVYLPAAQVTRSFAVTRVAQAIAFAAIADTQVEQGGLTVSATGGGSGNPVTFSSLTAPVCAVTGTAVTFATPGLCTIAADQAGDTVYAPAPQATRSFQVLPDVTPPDTTLTSGPTGVVNTARAAFGFVSPDATATFECSLDGAAFAACASPVDLAALAEGPHTFAVRAKDPAGNVDPTPAAASWTVDTLPPTLAFTSKPAITAANQAAYSVGGTCSDDGRAISVQIGSILASATCGTPATGEFATTPVDASGLAQGPVSLQASMTDAAGNPASITDGTAKDSLGPALTIGTLDIVNNGNKASYGFAGTCETAGGPVDFTLTSTATVSGSTACASGAFAVGGLDLAALADGTVAVSVTQADALGNTSIAGGSVAKDTAAPSVAIDAPVAVNAASVAGYVITGTCSENTRSVSLTVTDGTSSVPGTATCGAPAAGLFSVTMDLSTLADGSLAIAASHADAAGNAATANANATKDTAVAPPAITSPAAGAAVAANPAVSGTGETGATVTVLNGVAPVCTAPVVAGAWSCATTLGAGAYTLTATQVDAAGNPSATSAAVSFTVQGGQTITFDPLAARVFGDAPFTVSASASSGLTVQFSSTTTPVCTVAGTTVTLVAAGTCEVAADQPGDATNAPAPQVRQSFNVAKAAQSISFAPLAARTFGGAPFAVSATGGASGNPVVFSSLTPACSVAGNMVTLLGAGPCEIAADQAGNDNYLAAPRVSQSFAIARAAQAISFGALADRTFGEAPFAVSATGGGSGNPVVFSSLTPSCSVAGNTVTLLAVGSCTIAADQAGSADYEAAPQVARSFGVAQSGQAITFEPLAPRVLGVPPFTVSAMSTSGLPVAFSTTTTAVCTVSGTTVTLAGTGTCSIDADQAGDANYLPAPRQSQSFAVTPGPSSLTISTTGSGSGTVTSSPAGIDCGASCSVPFAHATVVTLTATGAAGSAFKGWTGACAGTGACVVTMDAARSVTAMFELRPVLADANGDRRADLFWREAAPFPGLSWWTMDGAAATGGNFLNVVSDWSIARVADLDGDGRTDLVWRFGPTNEHFLWRLDGLVPVGFADLGIPLGTWSLADAGDLDGDGKADLLWRNADGTVYAWLMNGGTIVGQGAIGNPGVDWQVIDLADMNDDGKADIVFRSTASGEVYVWYMNGLAIAGSASAGALDPASWTLRAVADFDGDGKGDFLWQGASGETWVWLMDGTAFRSGASIGTPGAGYAVRAVGDFDGDGRADIVWRHADGTTVFWRMTGTTVATTVPVMNPGGTWEIVAP